MRDYLLEIILMDSLCFFNTLQNSEEGREYLNLIERVKAENRGKKVRNDGFEVHHIFPYTWSSDSSESNTVLLTVPEHIEAHYYLARVFKGLMYYAFHILTGRTVKHLSEISLQELKAKLPYWTETRYSSSHRKHSKEEHESMKKAQKEVHSREQYRKALSIRMSELHRGQIPWNKGKTMSDEIRANMSKAMKGKKHVITDEHRKKLGEANRQKAQDPAYRAKLSAAKQGKRKIYYDLEGGQVQSKFVYEKDFKLYSGWYTKHFDKNLKVYQKEYLS